MALHLTVEEFKNLKVRTSRQQLPIHVKTAKGAFSRLGNAKLANLSTNKKATKKQANLSPSEHIESCELASYLEQLQEQGKILNFTHVANETYSHSWIAGRIRKNLGVRSGFPDYIIATHKELIFIEMKRVKGGKVSDTQKEWINQLIQLGFKVKVCLGAEDAKQFINCSIDS